MLTLTLRETHNPYRKITACKIGLWNEVCISEGSLHSEVCRCCQVCSTSFHRLLKAWDMFNYKNGKRFFTQCFKNWRIWQKFDHFRLKRYIPTSCNQFCLDVSRSGFGVKLESCKIILQWEKKITKHFMMSVDLTDHTGCDLTHQSSVIHELTEKDFCQFISNL